MNEEKEQAEMWNLKQKKLLKILLPKMGTKGGYIK